LAHLAMKTHAVRNSDYHCWIIHEVTTEMVFVWEYGHELAAGLNLNGQIESSSMSWCIYVE